MLVPGFWILVLENNLQVRGFAPIGLRPIGPTPRWEYWNDGTLEYWI